MGATTPPPSSQVRARRCPGQCRTVVQYRPARASPVPELVDDRGIDFRLPPLVDTARLRRGNSFGLAFLSQVGFELGEYAQLVEEGLAAVPVLIGCSVARNATRLSFSSRTMSCRSFNERASRSMRVTTRASPGRRAARAVTAAGWLRGVADQKPRLLVSSETGEPAFVI